MDNVEQIIQNVEKHNRIFTETRKELASKYNRDDSDARHTIFNKFLWAMTSTQLGLTFIMHHLNDPSWWTQKVKVTNPEEISTYVNVFDLFLKTSFFNIIFISIESSFRLYIRAIDSNSCSGGKAEFKNIYEYLLRKLELERYIPLLDLLRNIRNSLHNNGLFMPISGKNSTIQYNDKVYNFVVGEPVKVSWELVFNLMPEIKEMIVNVVESEKISSINKISEIT